MSDTPGFQYTIEIPIKSYLKKYLRHDIPVDPYTLSTEDFFGDWLLPHLKKQHTPGETVTQPEQYNDSLLVVIPSYYALHNEFIIGPKRVLRMNEWVEKLLNREVNRYLEKIRELPRQQLKTHTLDFLAQYGIEEDELAFETVKKRYQRWRQRLIRGEVAL